MKRIALIALSLLLAGECLCEMPAAKSGDAHLQKLAHDFWNWRGRYAPFTGDDVNRMERPGGIRDWSGASIERRCADLKEFEARWTQIDASQWPVSQQVDYRLIGSALARVHWELEINPRWETRPEFLSRSDSDCTRGSPHRAGALRRCEQPGNSHPNQERPLDPEAGDKNRKNCPHHLRVSRFNPWKASADACSEWQGALASSTTLRREELNDAAQRAADALEKFRAHLQQLAPSLPNDTALGREAYLFFLRKVALNPFTPEQLLAMGRQE